VIEETHNLKSKDLFSQSGSLIKADERRRMKESLLAPFQPLKPTSTMQSQSSGAGDMESKYKGVFGFGTPNIRPCKRMKHMDQTQIRSHINLRKM